MRLRRAAQGLGSIANLRVSFFYKALIMNKSLICIGASCLGLLPAIADANVTFNLPTDHAFTVRSSPDGTAVLFVNGKGDFLVNGQPLAEIVGQPGPPGPLGPQGNTVLNGTGAPDAALGIAGDFYIDTTHMRLYGPKTTGWSAAYLPMVGPQGPQGLTGLTGATGAAGAAGVAGPPGEPGATGSQGLTGPQGSQGVQGIAGPVGPAGPQGPEGPAGVALVGLIRSWHGARCGRRLLLERGLYPRAPDPRPVAGRVCAPGDRRCGPKGASETARKARQRAI
jgi:hypothetical protein